MTTLTRSARPTLADELSDLVREARQTCPTIQEKTGLDPAYPGGYAEATDIYTYVDTVRPELGLHFADWLASRRPITGASPAGTDIHPQRRLAVLPDGTVQVS